MFIRGSSIIPPENIGSTLYLMRLKKKDNLFNIEPIFGKPNFFRLSPNGKLIRPDFSCCGRRRVFYVEVWPFSTLLHQQK